MRPLLQKSSQNLVSENYCISCLAWIQERETESWTLHRYICVCYLGLTDDWFLVVTGNIVEPDSIVIEVVEDSHTELIALSVVRLRSVSASSIWPVDITVLASWGPGDSSSSNFSSSPEISLSILSDQSQELPFFSLAVDGYRSHPIGPTEVFSVALCERRTSDFPWNKKILSSEPMIGSIVSSAISPAPSILAATTRSLIPVSATTEQITKEVKLRGGGNHSEADEG